MSATAGVLLFVSFIFAVFYLWMRQGYSYWTRKNVPSVEPFPIFGNLKDLILRKRNGCDLFTYLYNHPKAIDQPIVGLHLFLTPSLMIKDLDLVKQILVRDFHKFSNRFASTDPVRDSLGWNNLFMIKSPKWKDLRSKLTPFFSSGNVRTMFPLISEIGNQLDKSLLSLNKDRAIIPLRELTSAYTTDVIATVAFGIQANSLSNPNADFRRHGRMITNFHPRRAFEMASIFLFPKMVTLLRSKLLSKLTSEFFRTTITHVINEREKSGLVRNDLIDMLLVFKKADSFDGNIDFLVAQAASFFLAGFHTSASAMTFALYELSKNEQIQQKLRNEIKETLSKNNGVITYEMLPEMQYLGMVLDETMRLYPPLPYLDRQCSLAEGEKDYSLQPYSSFEIPHGMPVLIPFFAIQRDPKYFPNPLTFDPERFSAKNKTNILPYSYMPFGAGPRSCIGERMAKIQSKIGLISILRNHYVVACDKTPPIMVLDSGALLTQEKGPVHVQFVRDPLLN